jgi:hypothetical protein
MTIQIVPSVAKGLGVRLFRQEVAVTAADSDAFVLPIAEFVSVDAVLSGAGTAVLKYTFGTQAEVEADTATWYTWDGTSALPLGMTAFYMDWTSGSKSAVVVVKIKDASAL